MNDNDKNLSGTEVSTIQVNSQVDTVESMVVEQSKSYDNTSGDRSQEYVDYTEHPWVLPLPNWTVINTLGTRQLVTNDLFSSYYINTVGAPLGNKLKNFFYFDGVMRVTYVVQGSSFAAGKLVISFDPDPQYNAQTSAEIMPPGMVRAFEIPHIVIDPSKTATYVIDLPCPTTYGVWCTSIGIGGASAGSYQVYTTVINPLISGTSVAPTIQMVGYYQLVKPKLEGLTYTLSSLKVEKSVKLSDVFQKASDVSKTLSGYVPSFSGELNLFSNVSESVGKSLAWFGFSKGPILETTKFLPSNNNNFARIDGRFLTDSLSLRSNNSVGISEESCPLLSQEDQTVSALCSRPGLVDVVSVPFATAANSLLKTEYVSPMWTYTQGNADGSLEVTPLGFCAYPYAYWSGSIDVDVDIVASVFHRATLVLIYEPHHNLNNDSVLLKMQANKHWTFYVSGNSSTRITIPWRQPNPWKTVTKPLVPAAMDSTTSYNCCNGTLRLYLLNTVTSNGSTDPIYVNFFYSSKDIQFAQVCDTNKTFQTVITFTSGKVLKTMGEEHAHTVKELASRMTTYLDFFTSTDRNAGWYWFTTRLGNTVGVVNSVADQVPGTLLYEPENLFNYLASAYVGNRGSINYSCIPPRGVVTVGLISVNDSTGHDTDAYGFDNGLLPDMSNFAAISLTNGRLDPIFSWTSPMYFNGYFRPFEMSSSEGQMNYSEVSIPYSSDYLVDSNNSHIQFLRGAGDDFQFVGFRGCPMTIYVL